MPVFDIGLNQAVLAHIARQGMSPPTYIKKLISEDMKRNPPPEGTPAAILEPLTKLHQRMVESSGQLDDSVLGAVADECMHLADEVKHGLEAMRIRTRGVE